MTVLTPGRLITLVRRKNRPACVMLPGGGGGVSQYLRISSVLGESHDVCAVRTVGLVAGEEPEDSVAGMADSALDTLDSAGVVPKVVFGWSLGGVVGWEVCVRLADRGVRPELVLVDSSPFRRISTRDADNRIRDEILRMLGPKPDRQVVDRLLRVWAAQVAALGDHETRRRYPGRTLLLTCALEDRAAYVRRWRSLATDLRVATLDTDHFGVFDANRLPQLAGAVTAFLDDVPVVPS